MKVSIVTVVYNNEVTIADAINSVLNQDYPDIEYIVIDGASKDKTLEVINSFGDRIDKVVSEPDKGIYDAMNKGVSLATGDIIGILNSDDFYKTNQVVTKVVNALEEAGSDSVYGDLHYVDPDDTQKVSRYWKSGEYNRRKFVYGWMPPHPTFFVRRSIYEKYGNFNLKLKSAADYEFMLRVLYKHRVSSTYIPETLILMRNGGNSNSSISHRIRANAEDREAWKLNGLRPMLFTRYLKPIRKVVQFFHNLNN